MMDHDATTPVGNKRRLPEAEPNPASTPASAKRRKLDEPDNQSPSTPRALNAIASAISGVLGLGRQQHKPEHAANDGQGQPGNAVPSPSAAEKLPRARPAIKLAALRGTKWDKGDLGLERMARKPATRPTRAAGKGRRQKQDASPIPSPRHPAVPPSEPAADDDIERAPAESAADTPTKPSSPARKPLLGSASKPKGILTPSKKRGRPPKSVTFNRGLDGEVYFEDLPKSPSAKKARGPKGKKAAEKAAEKVAEQAEGEDEIRCAVCSKPDSRPPNEIILCDNCDFAAHQECYGVPEIPEGDWLCKSCAQEDVLQPADRPTDGAPSVTAATTAEVPDIANLDHHLRSLQRVLLDRCCGRRRIRMFGQEDSYDKVRQLVEQTVVAGEGNSMLLLGPRGSGKTTVR
ncbi:hypothetical protein CDD83_2005 [Cordyceps sp. RAO-2017]|nr:hypothetical protein CDD83_2005 [Cordyceps sp. RAO-2017]